jgi:hypothetical protein
VRRQLAAAATLPAFDASHLAAAAHRGERAFDSARPEPTPHRLGRVRLDLHQRPAARRARRERLPALQFRVSVNFSDTRNAANTPQNFSVVLTDGAGATASVRVGDVSKALFLPAGISRPRAEGFPEHRAPPAHVVHGRKLVGHTLRQIHFDQKGTGALLVSDLAFAAAPVNGASI